MPKNQYTKTALKEAIAGKLQRHFGREVEDATKEQIYEACALVVRDALTEHMIENAERSGKSTESVRCTTCAWNFWLAASHAQQCL